MRLFLAIPLADSLTTALTRLVARLRPAAPDLRWSSSEAWHITLQFLGAATPRQYDCLLPRLAALKNPPLSIQLASLGVFERAGVFHLGVEPTPKLLALQQRVVSATTPCGFAAETRPYHPHITLARAKLPGDLRALAPHLAASSTLSSFTAREFLLYESRPSTSGSKYEILHRFPLTWPYTPSP